MMTRTLIILFLLIFTSFSGNCQLDSIEGYWFCTSESDTIILKVQGLNPKKKRNHYQIRKALQLSTNSKFRGVYYFSFDDDSLTIFDGYGNVWCKTLNYKMDENNWEINDEFHLSYSRITKEKFNEIKELIESKKTVDGKSENINLIDH